MKVPAHKWRNALCVAGLVSMSGVPGVASAIEVYDDFGVNRLNANRWIGEWISEDAMAVNRRVNSGSLQLGLYGLADRSTTGGRNQVRNSIGIPKTIVDDLKLLEVRARVVDADVRGCSVGANDSRARVRSAVSWFNDGSSTSDTDLTGDVQSYMGLRQNTGGTQLQIAAWAWRCDDADCATFTDIPVSAPNLGSAPVGSWVLLRQIVNRATGQIIFKAKVPGSPWRTTRHSFAGIASYFGPAKSTFNVIEARAEAENCDTSGGGVDRPYATINSEIDRVRITRYTN